MRLVVALVAIVVSFVALCNLAVFWYGAFFVAMLFPWGIAANRLFEWGKSAALSRQ